MLKRRGGGSGSGKQPAESHPPRLQLRLLVRIQPIVIIAELALFSSFGFVQLLQLSRSISAKKAEIIYTGLSFVSKTLLGWLVYAGNFVD
jgi:hypothetical protein